jgi:hypothetical protein
MEGGDASAVVATPPKVRRGSGAAIYEKYLNIKEHVLTNEDGPAVKKSVEISNSTGNDTSLGFVSEKNSFTNSWV